MNPVELRAAAGLAGLYALRMLGMFLILPVFAVYAGRMPGGENHALVGLAFGAFGLTQALLQLPMGMWSDRIGRKPVIYLGLALFLVGSLICAASNHIGWLILGRAVQGAGAISAAVTALLADLTREEHRTKAMAMIGMTIGLSFAVAMVVGPLLTRAFGLSGLFLATAAMAIVGLLIVALVVPRASTQLQHRESGVAGHDRYSHRRTHPAVRHRNPRRVLDRRPRGGHLQLCRRRTQGPDDRPDHR